MEELHRDPTVGHAPWSGPEVKNERSSAKGGVSERLRCRTIQEEVSQILQKVFLRRCKKILLPFYPA